MNKPLNIKLIEFFDDLKDAACNMGFIMFLILVYTIFIGCIVVLCSIL